MDQLGGQQNLYLSWLFIGYVCVLHINNSTSLFNNKLLLLQFLDSLNSQFSYEILLYMFIHFVKFDKFHIDNISYEDEIFVKNKDIF